VWGVLPAKHKTLLTAIPRIRQAGIKRERLERVEDAVRALAGPPHEAAKIVNVLLFIADEWDIFEDTAKSVLADFDAFRLLPSDRDKKRIARAFLADYLNILEKDSARRRANAYGAAIIPSLTGIDCLVDFRAVIRRQFRWKTEAPETYVPTCERMEPTIIVEISRDKDDPIVFQCTTEDLRLMISKLQATLKEHEIAKEFLSVRPGGSRGRTDLARGGAATPRRLRQRNHR
jgi:hypothetical protein